MVSSITRFDIEKFDGKNDFGLWQIKMCALMVQQGCDAALETLPADMEAGENAALMKKAYNTLILCLGDRVLREVTKETSAAGIWTKLTSLYMTKSLANRLYLKKKLYTYYMSSGMKLGDHIDEFNKLILDLANIDIEIEDEDQPLMLGRSVPSAYNRTCTIKGTGKVKIQLHDGSSFILEDVRYVPGLRRSLISLGTLEKEGYTVKMQMGRIKVIKGCRVTMTGIRKKNCVYTLEAKVMTFGVQNHGGSKQVRLKQLGSKQVGFKQLGHKQVGFKQLGPGVKTGVHGVQDVKRVWFEVKLQGAQGDREAEVFQVSNDDAVVAQRRLEDKQLEEKTNTDCLVKEQEKVHLGIKVRVNITVTGVPGQEGAEGNVAGKKKVKESKKANLL
ncbi:hypothetical protein Tco_0519940 [Tanacetum coccineum]